MANTLVRALFVLIAAVAAVFPAVMASSSLRRLDAMNFQAAMLILPSECTVEHGFDYVGHDLTNVPGDWSYCCTLCGRTTGCTAWTWTDFKGGTCWLKSGRGEIVVNANAKSALYFFTPQPLCLANHELDYVGNDLVRVPGANVSLCCDACQKTLGCRAYSWSDYEGGSCWLKSTVTEAVYKPGVHSARAYPSENQLCLELLRDTDIVGNDVANRRSANPESCCDICKTVAGCTAFSWSDYEGGTCWLKSAKGDTVSKAGVVSARVWQ